jgi:hypothetical protein
MKTEQQINDARRRILERMKTPGLSDLQKTLLSGMLNALVWAADGRDQLTMQRMLSDEPMAAGQDHTAALKTLRNIGG